MLKPIPTWIINDLEPVIEDEVENNAVNLEPDLENRWHEEQRIDDEGNLFAIFDTWHLSGFNQQRRHDSRRVFLYADFANWRATILHLWRDVIDPAWPVEFFLVQGDVPVGADEEDLAGHIIVLQHGTPGWAAVLGTAMQFHELTIRQEHIAFLVRDSANCHSILQAMSVHADCPPIDHDTLCTCWLDEHRLAPDETQMLHNGKNVVIYIQAATQPQEHDVVELMQRPRWTTAQEFYEELNFWEELSSAWRTVAHTGDFCEPSATVVTYFLHPHLQRVCAHPRTIVLHSDPGRWEEALRRAWNDIMLPDVHLRLWITKPTPLGTQAPVSAHVLLGQSIPEDQRCILTSLYDQTDPQPTHIATIEQAPISPQTLLVNVGRLGLCGVRRVYHGGCILMNGDEVIPNDITVIQPRNGQNFRVLVPRAGPATPSRSPVLIQLATHLAAKPKPLTEATELKVDLDPVWNIFQSFDAHFTLPVYDPQQELGAEAQWHAAALDWLALPWYAHDMPCYQLQIFFDGSCRTTSMDIGFAAVAFVETDVGWMWAGATSGSQPKDSSASYKAELCAAIIAGKFAYDLLKGMEFTFGCIPDVTFLFDCVTVGKQMEGLWEAKTHKQHAHLLRSIVKIIETRFQIAPHYQHTPGHMGNPGNEIADAIANSATGPVPLHDWHPFFEEMLTKGHVQAIQWAWMLFDTTWMGQMRDTHLFLPAKPSTQPTLEHIRLPSASKSSEGLCTVELKVATGNVLTLSPQSLQQAAGQQETGAAGPSRLESLLRQMDEAGIQIFALQETRLRHFCCREDPRYVLLNAPATAAGHLGLMIGLHRVRPHGIDPKGCRHAFDASHVSIIDSGPRKLLLRIKSPVLRCIIVAAHAPHQGNDFDVIDAYWHDLQQTIPKKYANWPIIMLADANCRVGQGEDEFIGSWQSETETDKSSPFRNFVGQNNLWLPATFETSQVGPSGTWQHTGGNWSRIDFVGLPRCWSLTYCQASVETEVDISLQREDHRMTAATFHFHTVAPGTDRLSRTRKISPDAVDWNAIWQMGHSQWVNPEQDIHTHAAEIQDAILRWCTTKPKQRQQVPLKTTMSCYTWELVKEKKTWRNHLAILQQHQRQQVLHGIFTCWKNHRHTACPGEMVASIDRIVANYDLQIAVALQHFRALGRRVSMAMRKDDRAFFVVAGYYTLTCNIAVP